MFTVYSSLPVPLSIKVVNQFAKIHATLPLHLSSPPSVTHRYPYLIQLLERRGMPKHCHVTTSEVG
ncbi:MAG: hypothetical protein KH071_11700 [Paraprevotella sp.]|uniref:hypothetical protein n=1 Tax=Paraprevotella sp. TaxID=2049036 RepID=UPI00257D0429|nr:hypothetical protein [Paraprevotella sp.]MBS4808532.1 hypothetical protein [Paraprevotella sp.]